MLLAFGSLEGGVVFLEGLRSVIFKESVSEKEL